MAEEDKNQEFDTDDISNDESENIEDTPKAEPEEILSDQEKLSVCEDKLQRVLADYQNLDRRNNIEASQKILKKDKSTYVGLYWNL